MAKVVLKGKDVCEGDRGAGEGGQAESCGGQGAGQEEGNVFGVCEHPVEVHYQDGPRNPWQSAQRGFEEEPMMGKFPAPVAEEAC